MKKLLFLFVLLPISLNTTAQNFKLEYDHTALLVTDLNRSADFYSRLGLEEIPVPYKNPELRWFSLGGNEQLHLIKVDSAEIKLHKAIHVALNVNNFDFFIQHLENSSVKYWDWTGVEGSIALRGDGVKQVYIIDPDGHWIEINDAYN